MLGTSLLCFYFYLLCYAAVLTYHAQYYAHVKDLCLGIQYFALATVLYVTGSPKNSVLACKFF